MTRFLNWIPVNDIQLAEHAMDIYGAELERDWIRDLGVDRYESDFLLNGYHLIPIPDQVVAGLWGFFDESIVVPFAVNDCSAAYISSDLTDETAKRLNAENIYYGPPCPEARNELKRFLSLIALEIESELAQHWRVINVRAWKSRPQAAFGPSDWHVDGYSPYVRKLMLYLQPPNEENGSIEICDRAGNTISLENSSAVCVLCDTSILLHRGRPSRTNLRPAIEITIMPAQATSIDFIYAGQNARYLRSMPSVIVDQILVNRYDEQGGKGALKRLKFLYDEQGVMWILKRLKSRISHLVGKIYKKIAIVILQGKRGPPIPPTEVIVNNLYGEEIVKNHLARLNLGGGSTFHHPGWVNLEAVASASNPFPFSFSRTCVFPLPSSVVQLVYSSHCLGRLDDQTVEHVLREARRVLSPKGYLLLKSPDFELVKQAWRTNDSSFFRDQWGLESVIPTWQERSVEDNIDNRAAMIFCGFWNKVYGDHFARRINFSKGGYHGPPVVPHGRVAAMLSNLSSHNIAKELSDLVRAEELDYTFNHQNAWDKADLEELLIRTGFTVKTFGASDICRIYSDIPKIMEMREISMYCVATPSGY